MRYTKPSVPEEKSVTRHYMADLVQNEREGRILNGSLNNPSFALQKAKRDLSRVVFLFL